MSSPLQRTFETFSLSHAAILNPSTGAELALGDIYGVRTASIALDTGNYDNTGDDFVLSTWQYVNFATVTVESGYVSYDVVSLLAGYNVNATTYATAPVEDGDQDDPYKVSTSATAPIGDTYEIDLWNEDSGNQRTFPMIVRSPSRDADGNPRAMDLVLYKVNFSPLSFTGPAYKDGAVYTFTGRAVLSNRDEQGRLLAKRSIGRLINRPV